MKVVIGFSHVDSLAALRLLLWVDYLGGVSDPVCVVSTRLASKRPAALAIQELLRERFPKSEWHVLQTEDERGWPHSSTHLFANSLRLAGDDILWLEPDCVPMRKGWYDELKAAWKAAGTPFVGCFIKGVEPRRTLFEDFPGVPDHMTGCGFYGREWARVCPSLGQEVTRPSGAWDLDCARDMLAHFTHTPLIQHYWQRDKAKARVDLASVRPGTALYHQCKDSSLMRQIDPAFFTSPLTLWAHRVTTSNTMPKIYLTENVARPLPIKDAKVEFEPCEFFAPTSSWWGVFATEDSELIEKLEPLVASGALTEISEAECKLWLAKRKNPSSSHNITQLATRVSNGTIGAPKPAVVAEPTPAPAVETVSEALRTAPVGRKNR